MNIRLVSVTERPSELGVRLVGVVFGVVPARKTARLNPLAALCYE